ncbi:MAG: hypothetical protein QXR73_02430 [Candidatus Micrarchaeaceae archaeon]
MDICRSQSQSQSQSGNKQIIETIAGRMFSFTHSDKPDAVIHRSALLEMLIDMDRGYETAGFLFGHSADGTIVFDLYAPMDVSRYGKDGIMPGNKWESQLEHYARKGYDSVMFVHTHRFANYENYSDATANPTLIGPDEIIALSHEQVSSKKGFRHIYEGIVSIYLRDKVFNIATFDLSNGAERSEGIDLYGEVGQKMHALGLMRKDLQTIKYIFDEALSYHLIIFKLPDTGKPKDQYLDDISRAINAIVPDGMQITIVVDDQKERLDYWLHIIIPPISHIHLKYYTEILERVAIEISNAEPQQSAQSA